MKFIDVFLTNFPECNYNDIDCMDYLYPIWKQYKNQIVSPRINSSHIYDMYKTTEEFNTVNRHDSSSLLKNVTIATTEVLLELGNARYKETKKFPRRHGGNCGGGVYTQISAFDSFPKKLVLKRCASRYEVENTLVMNYCFLPFSSARLTPPLIIGL